MSIDSPEELAALEAAGRVVAEAIREMSRRVRPGVTTRELDDVAARMFAAHGARSGPQLDYDFPGVTCISVDDECVHGIPSDRRLRDGQLVKLDVTAELERLLRRRLPHGRRRQGARARAAARGRRAVGAAPRPARPPRPAPTSARSAPPSTPR